MTDVAPANPTSVASAPPPDSVPPGGDEPSAEVIDELLAAFANRAAATAAPPPAGVQQADRPQPSAPPAPPTRSTRVMSSREILEHAEQVPPAEPRPDETLLPEPTRRSRRRSKREAKREARREAKRLARLANEKDKQAKRSRRQRRGQGDAAPQQPVESTVRFIPSDPAAPAARATPGASPPAVATVAIADDGGPDAVYVEGELGVGGRAEVGPAGTGRSTVFIDEDRSATDVVTMDVATSATRIEPRMRERRIAVKRAVGRRRLKWVAIVAGVALILVAMLAVMGSGLFAVEQVGVEGAVYSVGSELDAVVESLDGANVLRIDTAEAESQLEAIPWVADARVTTDFPNGATIEIRERRPSVAFQGTDGRYRVLDRDGRVLDVIAGQPTAFLELMVLDGPAPDLEAGQSAPPGLRAAATLVAALTPQMRQRAGSVSANADATDLRLTLEDQASPADAAGGVGAGEVIEVRFGAAQDLVAKLVRLQTALTDPDPERVPTEMIDVSTQDLIIR